MTSLASFYNQLPHMTLALICFVSMATGPAGTSAPAPFEVTKASLHQSELELEISDLKEVSNACPLYISRMEFLLSINTLVIDVKAPEPCPLEVYGKRVGLFKWMLPSHIRGRVDLKLLVNDTAAGTLQLNHGTISFVKPPTTSPASSEGQNQ